MFEFHAKFLLVAVITAFTVDAVEFDCDFGRWGFYPGPDNTFFYTCARATVVLTGSTTLENVTGVHLSGYTNEDVGWLWIENQNLPFFPRGIENFFKNLEGLMFIYSQLVSISAADLQPFPQLQTLYLSGNSLTSLDGDLFKHTPLLEFLLMGLNRIQHIGHDLLTNLEYLEILWLHGNICIDRSAGNRSEVVELAPLLAVMCPPLDGTTTIGTTTIEATTTQPSDECPCDEEIEELRAQNLHLFLANEKLFDLNAAIEERLLAVEMKLQEILTMSPHN